MIALALAALAGLAVVVILRTFRAARVRTRASRIRKTLGRAAGRPLAEGVVTIEGTLKAEPKSRLATFFPASVSLIERPTSGAESASRPASLNVDEVLVEGDVQVIHGSLETDPRATAAQARALGAGVLARPGMLRAVEVGDRVAVRGRLEAACGETSAGYRAGSIAFRLVAAEADEAVPLVYLGKPRPLDRKRIIFDIAVGVFVACCAFPFIAGVVSRHERSAIPMR